MLVAPKASVCTQGHGCTNGQHAAVTSVPTLTLMLSRSKSEIIAKAIVTPNQETDFCLFLNWFMLSSHILYYKTFKG